MVGQEGQQSKQDKRKAPLRQTKRCWSKEIKEIKET
jgi:hypothetical protein